MVLGTRAWRVGAGGVEIGSPVRGLPLRRLDAVGEVLAVSLQGITVRAGGAQVVLSPVELPSNLGEVAASKVLASTSRPTTSS